MPWVLHSVYIFAVLQQPLNARAVWTNSKQIFYICWEWPDSQSSGVEYNIFDARLSYLSYMIPCNGRSHCAILRKPPTSEDIVFIQATSPTALPSVPLPVYISGMGNFIFTLS